MKTQLTIIMRVLVIRSCDAIFFGNVTYKLVDKVNCNDFSYIALNVFNQMSFWCRVF